MNVQSFSFFYAVLALACWAGAIALLIGAFVRRFVDPEAFSELRSQVGKIALPLAWAIAFVTTIGSLYYSKVQGYEPCELCWYQRICLYPWSVVLGIAAWRRDTTIKIYAIPVLCIGIIISAYHSWIQWFPPSTGTSFCSADAPCTTKFVNEFSFVTLPFMALSAAVFMVALLLASTPSDIETDIAEEVEVAK
ncbi:MAG: disulfide bond formation protein B [Acidimicrobiales bacterium]